MTHSNMNSIFKKGLLLMAVVSTLALTGCADDKLSDQMQDDDSMVESYKIGFIGPLTGNAAAYGQDMLAGVNYYFKQHPTINGVPVEVVAEDGKCTGQDAANAAQKLITVDKVQVIVGAGCSGETLAAAPIAEQNQVVLLSPLSSSPEITDAGQYIFRNYPSDAQVGATLANDVVEHGYKKVAILSEQTDYAQAYRATVREHFEANAGVEVVVDEAYQVDNTDFRTLLTKVKDAGADVLVSISQSPVGNGFTVKQARELGINIQVYGTDSMTGPEYVDTAKDAAEGSYSVLAAEDSSREGYQEFAEAIGTPQYAMLFAAFAYDAADIVATAIEKEGYSGEAIRNYLNNMAPYQGLASDVNFDENGDNQVPAGVLMVKDGDYVVRDDAMMQSGEEKWKGMMP
ncbi:ABC transporter substrate-binding protein [Candidatus Peregrinibacteria bacterium]|nr:MAG: ABC transporter substrate-binding protein [Candidatus Peregrinibacteria bacterium]